MTEIILATIIVAIAGIEYASIHESLLRMEQATLDIKVHDTSDQRILAATNSEGTWEEWDEGDWEADPFFDEEVAV